MPEGATPWRAAVLVWLSPGNRCASLENALIRPALSCNQVLGRSLLKQAGCFEANRACEGVGAEASNHRTPMDQPARSSCAFELTAKSDRRYCLCLVSRPSSGGRWANRGTCHDSLLGVASNRKQHLGLSVDTLAAFRRTCRRRLVLREAASQRVHQVDHVMGS